MTAPDATSSADEGHLRVYGNRSVLIGSDGNESVFPEGAQSTAARERYGRLREGLASFLSLRIEEVLSDSPRRPISHEHRDLIDGLVGGITSEVGRGLVGVAVTQAAIKALEPTQSIRLHKGSPGRPFGWTEGLSLRTLSATVSAVLRQQQLLRLNTSGPMMTRSLAENYPYSMVYKADIRGPRREWFAFVEDLDSGRLQPDAALEYLLLCLIQRSEAFREAVAVLLEALDNHERAGEPTSIASAADLLLGHVAGSSHSARLFEVSLHSLLQVTEDLGCLRGALKPLMQMRTADLKARRIAEIEVSVSHEDEVVLEAWDAKYGRPYLLDEIGELGSKLVEPAVPGQVGFVCDGAPILSPDIVNALDELGDVFGIEVRILSFADWVAMQTKGCPDPRVGDAWIRAYAESLALLRPSRAPIDEPTHEWIGTLTSLLESSEQ